MKKRAIVCVSFGAYYEKYRQRLSESIKVHAPEEHYTCFDSVQPGWIDHKAAPYGFKINAVREMGSRGFDHVLWLDAGAYLIGPIDRIWDRIEQDGHYLVRSCSPLADWISEQALRHFGLSRQAVREEGWPLLCGMPYGFDLSSPKTVAFMDEWYDCAKQGLFQEQSSFYREDPRVQGHRHDEAIGAVLVRKHGMVVSPFGEIYSGDGGTEGSCIASGYNEVKVR